MKQLLKQHNLFITEQEKKVLTRLSDAWEKFNKLLVQHPSDRQIFLNSIHSCQQIIALRIVRRLYPQIFKTITENKGDDHV